MKIEIKNVRAALYLERGELYIYREKDHYFSPGELLALDESYKVTPFKSENGMSVKANKAVMDLVRLDAIKIDLTRNQIVTPTHILTNSVIFDFGDDLSERVINIPFITKDNSFLVEFQAKNMLKLEDELGNLLVK